MATIVQPDQDKRANSSVDPNRILSETFAQVFRAYKEASDTVQEVIRDMCEIINDPETNSDDHDAAVATLVEALFPTTHNGELGIDVDELREIGFEETPEFGPIIKSFESEEISFADRLKKILTQRGMKQEDLARLIDVQQPAVSMMLSRECRPQRKTVERIAKALEMSVADLWPGN